MSRFAAVEILLAFAFSSPTFAGTGEISFTPASYKVPVHSVTIGGDGASTALINCSGADDDCLIDFADQTALDAIAATAATTINAGEYSEGTFSLCGTNGEQASTSHNLYVKGTATIGGTDYYTTSESSVLTTDASKYGYATVTISTCQVNFKFTSTFTAGTEDITITLFPMITNVAAMSTSGTAMNGFAACAKSGSNEVCLNYPGMVPYVGDTTATLHVYDLHQTASAANTAGGSLLLVADALGELFGGWAITLKSATSTQLSGFGQAVNYLRKNSGAETYTLKTYGSNPVTESCGYLTFESFALSSSVGGSHASTYLNSSDGTCSGAGTSTVNYTAVRTK